ncbi:MAG: FAD-dependent oxidoreductase, partial [Armatimonadota bacterium]|nr:FAD-dependent oxidoreductase [Armatimonadota bacterium]
YRQYQETGTFLFPHGGGIQLEWIRRGLAEGTYPETVGMHRQVAALQMHAIRDLGVVHLITGFVTIDDLDVAKITRAMTDGKRMAFTVTDYFRRHVPGFERAFVANTADDLGMRATRWIEGDFVFTPEMKSNPTRFDDAVGRGVVQRDFVKSRAPGAWNVQTFYDASFDIPYRCLLPRGVEGLLMGAGRSVSAMPPTLLRVMALTMVVGQAAGAAAAVAARQKVVPREVDVRTLQQELRQQGVTI